MVTVMLVLYLLDICQIDGNANFITNFTTEQKVDFIIKITEQQVSPLLLRYYFYVYVQHSIVISSSIF